jgi:hypothetical protein
MVASPAQPVLIEQSATREVQISPASNTTGKPANALSKYMGKMNLPRSQEKIATPALVSSDESPSPVLAQSQTRRDTSSSAGLRITSQPMDPAAARAQALFAEQTDGQLTQDSAANIRVLPNAPVQPLALPAAAGEPPYNLAQYTPSAQEAATGAYSSRQQSTQPQQTPAQAQPAPEPLAKPVASRSARKKAARRARRAETSRRTEPTLASAPSSLPGQPAEEGGELPSAPPSTQTPTSATGLTDEELQDRDLPPLRGPWVRIQREKHPISPRDEAEMQLRFIESGYSAWLGGSGIVNYRSGDLGYDHLSALEAPFEASIPLGYGGRITFVARPVFLDSGQADGNSVITVLEGGTTTGIPLTPTTIPQPIGTLVKTNTIAPPQQNASGLGGEVQLAFPHFVIAGGYTPADFLVSTFTARMQWKPENGPFTFSFTRDSVKDTQLSYAGLRDPKYTTLGDEGPIWGGVMANQGNIQYARGDAQSGFYMGAGGQVLRGYNVVNNYRIDGSGGAYWRVLTTPEYGNLSLGVNFFGMHYQQNEDAFTRGMGGYFSPQAYFLANAPITWTGHYQTRWHYNILGSLGVQAFQVDQTQLWPLAADNATQVSMNNPQIPAKTSVGPNYDFRTQVAYQISPHWFAGGFFGANNSRNYTSVSTGFYVRYLFRSQPSTVNGPTGIFPTDGVRPFSVP